MGKKSKKKSAEKHPLLQTPDTYALGKRLTVWEVFEQYTLPELKEKKRRPSTLQALERDVRRFGEWWASESSEPLPVAIIRRKTLEQFRKWIGLNGGSVAQQNASTRSIQQVLNSAVRWELMTDAPKIESLTHKGVAPKVYPSNEELNALWRAADRARWPSKRFDRGPLGYSAAVAWRVALILWRTYGFRTQELVQNEDGFRPLRWENIHGPGITPNPEGRAECRHGWLRYVPQKQERVKPEPVVAPLTAHVRAALDCVWHPSVKPTDSVFAWPLSSVSFYQEWHRLCLIADIAPRNGSGVERYCLKHLRKAATSEINNHRSGMAQYIVGHAVDRSGQISVISSKHYNNAEMAILECMETLPMPSAFDEIFEMRKGVMAA